MASLLHKSTPWIEDSFVYACSFDASRFDDESDEEDNEFNDDEEMEQPSTQNTIPDGLHDDDDDDDDGEIKEGSRKKNKPPPSRGGKIVQIIDRGGDVNFYKQKGNDDDGGNDNNTHCCPPYLILHDGQYSTIAFLSEEAYNSTVLRQHVRRGAMQQHIPKKSLISISQYTISTIKCCTQLTNSNNGEYSRGAVFGLQLLRPDMPQPHLSQIQSTLNTNLLLCLYVLGPITLIGAENQGLIGNTINVNCSVKVRRVLQSHMAQFDKVHTAHNDACVNREEEDEEEDYQHWTMVQRLEACHCYYQLLKEKRGGTIPVWPWESRLVDGEMEDENDEEMEEEEGEEEENIQTVSNKGPSSGAIDDMDEVVVEVEAQGEETVAAIATAASPGRVERMIRKYESLEELLEGDEENVEGDDAADIVGDGDDHDIVETKAGRASTGTYLAKWDDSDEDQSEGEEGGEKEAEQEGNKGKGEEGGQQQQQQQQQQRQDTDQDEGGEEKEQGTNTKNDDAQMEQGDVAELFDNFEDINEIIDLGEEDSPPTEEVVESTSANLNDDAMDGDNVAGQGGDLDNNNDEDGNNNAATFVGIDQMFVDEEEEEVKEDEEEDDEDEQVPLLTQQEFGTHKEVQEEEEEEEEEETEHEPYIPEPPQEVVASQIPIPRAAVNKGTKTSEGDKHANNICANEYVESQVPFPPPKDTQSSDESDREEIYEDVGTESQIPFPSRSKHQKQSLNDDEDEEVMSYPVESQIPFPQKHSTKKDHSPQKKPNNKSSKSDHVRPKRTDLVIYDSDDSADWMRIRKAKTKAKSTKSTKKVQSQMAGEGSEEIIPSSNALNTSQIVDDEEGEVEDDETAEEEMQQQPGSASIAQKEPSSSEDPSLLPPRNTETSRSARTSAHRVHFATDNTDLKPPANVTQATNLRELFTSVSSKASNILFQSQSNGADTNEVVTRKRKARDDDRKEKKEEFSFATMFDRAKRSYCSSSTSDDF